MTQGSRRHMVPCVVSLFVAIATEATLAGDEQWTLVRPSNTGIPGLQLHGGRFAPDGTLWVTGRWPFWGEGGIGIYDIENDQWTTLSNVNTPIPSEWVNGIAFDSEGAAWLATSGGLVKKQGDQWTLWTTANAPFLHNVIRRVAIAPNGRIWVNNSSFNASNSALFEFDGQNWTRYRVGEQIPFPPPWVHLDGMFFSADGHLWVTNISYPGIVEYDGQTWTYRDPDFGVLGSGREDANGDIWILPGSAGGDSFYRYRRQADAWDEFGWFNAPLTPTADITSLAIDAQQRVHVGNWYGEIIRFDGASWTRAAYVGDAVYGIAFAGDGDLWVTTLGNGTTGEVHHLDPQGNVLRRYNTWNTGMVDYFIDRFDLDSAGNLWFACGEGGLSRFDGRRWRNWGAHNSGSEPYPWGLNEPMGGFFMDSTGTGWMGGNGIGRWNPATGQFTGFWNYQNNPGMGVTTFSTFAEDAAGNLFAASIGGAVYRFNGSVWVSQPANAGGYTSTYAGLKSDSRGRVWAIGWLGAWLWDGTSWSQVGQSWDLFGLGGATAYDIAADDTMWIGTNQGLLRVSPQGQTTLFTPANSPLPARQVQGIDIRADGLLAVSAHLFQATTPFPNGVALIDGPADDPANWTVYRYGQDPIPHYQLGAVQFDAQGDLWISAISESCAVLDLPAPLPPGDIDGDGDVDMDDRDLFVGVLIGTNTDPDHVARSDLNGDGAANGADVAPFVGGLLSR